jgi:hypothetical protein
MQKNAHTFDVYGNFMLLLTLQICSSAYLGPGPPGFKLVHPLQWAHAFCVPVLNRLSARSHTHTMGRLRIGWLVCVISESFSGLA